MAQVSLVVSDTQSELVSSVLVFGCALVIRNRILSATSTCKSSELRNHVIFGHLIARTARSVLSFSVECRHQGDFLDTMSQKAPMPPG